MKEERTSIQVSVETKNRLLELGKKAETYNNIIRRLLDRQDLKKGGK